MTPEEARAAVEDALTEVAPDVDVATLDPERPLQEQADLDSLDILNLLELLEARTGVALDADAGLRTLAALTGRLLGTR